MLRPLMLALAVVVAPTLDAQTVRLAAPKTAPAAWALATTADSGLGAAMARRAGPPRAYRAWPRRWTPVRVGVAVGFGVGALAGAVGGYLRHEPCSEGPACFPVAMEMGAGAMIVGLGGAVVGGVTGGVVGWDMRRRARRAPDGRIAAIATPTRAGIAVRF